MKIVKNYVRGLVLRSDMFAAQPTLRFNGESSYQTVFGGCLSLLLVTAFAVIFSRSFIDVLNKVNITAQLNIEDNPYETSEISGIGLAVGISGLDFSSSERYFNIILKIKNTPLGGAATQTEIGLSSCNSEDWESLGDNFSKLFSVYGMSKMLCPTDSSSLVLKGFEGSEEWITMSILVEQCRNRSTQSWTCHTPAQITAAFNTYLTNRDFLKVSLLILNTVISPQQEDATKSVLENEIFVTFSNTSGSRCDIKLGRYEITTDNSIWPVSNETTEEGYYITSHETYSINLYSTHYVRIEIEKARTVYEITRTHDKLDEMLSYVGGLFSLLFGWLFFFIGSYNQYKYEIAVAEHTFSLDGTGRKIRQDNFGFFAYFKYCIFGWLKAFKCCCAWPAMEQIDAAREEACEQMDIRYLMKKVQRYEIINKFLMGQHNMIMANLSRPPTLEQVKRMRKITQYYDKVIKIENEENLLQSILKVSSRGKNNQVFNEEEQKKTNKAEQNIELDSEDQEIEREIAQIFRIKKLEDLSSSQLSQKILEQVPESMKDRLRNVKSMENSEANFIEKEKIKIESTFSMIQSQPNFFLASLGEYKQQK